MKLSKLALAGALVGLMSAGSAYAQNGWGQPAVTRTSYEFSSYYAQSDAPPAAAPAPAAAGCDAAAPSCSAPCAPACDDGCSCCGGLLNPCCCLGEQWKMFDSECLKCRGINISGYLIQSFAWNTSSPADRFNGPVTMTDRSN